MKPDQCAGPGGTQRGNTVMLKSLGEQETVV